MASKSENIERAVKIDENGRKLEEKSFIHYLPIVIVGILIAGVPSAVLNNVGGIYYTPMSDELGVPVSQIGLWRSIDYITGLIAAPLVGVWFTKHNSKALILICVIVESLMLCCFGLVTEAWMLYIVGAIVGVTNITILGIGVSVIMNRWFRASVGMVIGICGACTGIGGMIFTPIGQSIMEASSWRTSYITLGIASLVIMTIAVLFLMKDRPEDRGMLPYGTARAEAKEKEEAGTVKPIVPCVRPKVARRSYIFWTAAIMGLLINGICQMTSYFPTYVVWFNEQPDVVSGAVAAAFVTGAQLAIFNSAGNALGKIAIGVFTDINLRTALTVMSGAGILGVLFMWLSPNTVLLPIGSLIMGLFIAGVIVVMPMVVREIFGAGASFPIIMSNTYTVMGIGGAFGAYFWGWVSETLGGFSSVFIIALIGLVAVMCLGFFVYSKRDVLPREELTEADL